MSDERRRNAVDDAFVVRLNEAIDRAEERHDAALVIRSSLEKVFCSGADLTLPDAERALVSDRLYATYQRMLDSPVIFVAEAAGAAVGGGAQLCLASDVCMVTPDAWFRFAGAGAWPGRRCVGAREHRRASRGGRHVPHDAPGGRAGGHPVGDRHAMAGGVAR